jgi:hypothetical protein
MQAVERGARESMPLVFTGNLLAMLQTYMKGITGSERTYLGATEEIE